MNQQEILKIIRSKRLPSDFREMSNIKGAVINWKVLKGMAPFVISYQLEVNIRTLIGDSPSYRIKHLMELNLPANYPKSAPEIRMISRPYPFHPNWFRGGKWCFGTWDISEGLGAHVVRMLRTLQYDKEVMDIYSPANIEAKDWYLKYEESDLFPCDKQDLPDPTGKSNLIVETKKFKINGLKK